MRSEPVVSIPLDLFVVNYRESHQSGEYRCHVCGQRERFLGGNFVELMNRLIDHVRRCASLYADVGPAREGTLIENHDWDALIVTTRSGNCGFEPIPDASDAKLAAIVRQRLFDHTTAVENSLHLQFGHVPSSRPVRVERPGTRTMMLARTLLARLTRTGLLVPMLAEFVADPDVPLKAVTQELDDIEELLRG